MNKPNKSGSWTQLFIVGLVACILTFLSLSSGWGANLVINGVSTSMCGSYTFDTVIVTNNGRIYVTPYDGSTGGWLRLNVNQLVSILNGGAIVADTVGYRGSGTGEGEGPGGGQNGGGAGYGGRGGLEGGQTIGAGSTYGNWSTASIDMGSGGAYATDVLYVWGGIGGGSVAIYAKTITIANGCYISANGGDGQYYLKGAGGGSGGGILLSADTISLNGLLYANGGNGGSSYLPYYGGGGGGGRIKLFALQSLTWSGVSSISVTGGVTGNGYADFGTIYPNTFPVLYWAGTTGFMSDGIFPDQIIIYQSTQLNSLYYEVKYQDADNHAPAPGYPKVHILKDGTNIGIYPMKYLTGTYTTGAIYSYSTTLMLTGSTYSYWFEAYDSYWGPAYGTPTVSKNGPVVMDTPVLSWTGESGYETDGVSPDYGKNTTIYTYRVKYVDIYNHAPLAGSPRVHILQNGSEISGGPFAMSYSSGNVIVGAIYSFSTTISISSSNDNYAYYFDAQDFSHIPAIGTPTTIMSGPRYNNDHNPVLSWAGDSAGYLSDGIDPEHGWITYYQSNWTTAITYPLVVSDMAGVSYNQRIYILGGATAQTEMVDAVYSYLETVNGSWRAEKSLLQTLSGLAAFQYHGRIYAFGGYNGSYQSTVQYTAIGSKGVLGTWVTLNPLPEGRAYHQAVVTEDGRVYVLGGESASGNVTTVYYATIESDGSLSAWTTVNSLPAGIKNQGACYWRGYIYSLGGALDVEYTDAVYRAAVQSNGSLGSWSICSALPIALAHHQAFINEGRMYVVGGDNLIFGRQSTMYYSTVQLNGDLSTWKEATALPEVVSNAAVACDSGIVRVIGGFGITERKNTHYVCNLIDTKNTLGAWQAGPYTNTGLHSSIVWNGRIYMFGYGNSANSVRYGNINTDGSLGEIKYGLPLPKPVENFSCVVWNGCVYIIGGYCDETSQSPVYYSKINTDGSLGLWQATTVLPIRIWDHSAVVWNSRIYITGGHNGTDYQSTVYYAVINSDGSLGAWQTGNALPVGIYQHSSIVWNGRIYITGGYSEYQNRVRYAVINNDGSLGAWQMGTNLPQNIYDHSSLIHNGKLYVIGGRQYWSYLNIVYSSDINSDGSLDAWQTETFLPINIFGHSAVECNNRIYVTGGNTSHYIWYSSFMELDPSTDFLFRVKYTNIDGKAPLDGYPKVYVYKGGALVDTYTMSSETSGSYATGKIYSVSPYYYMPGYDYTYRFEAYDDSGLIALGEATSLKNGPYISQDTEYGLSQFKATAGDKQVQLSWFTTGNPWYVGTMIRRRTDHYPTSTSDGTQIYWYNGKSYTDTNLSNGVTYYYTAFVQDALNQLTVAQNAMATPRYSKNVQNVVVASGDKQVRLTWTNPVGADYSATKILRRTDRYPTGPTDGSVIYWYNGTTCVDAGLTNGQTYYYGVFAHDTSYSYATGVFKSAYLNYNSTDGDFNSPSDTTNWAFQLPGNVNLMPTVSWLSSYNGRTGIMRINYSSQTEGLKLTGIPRLGASAANNWYRLRVQYSSDSPNAGHEIFTQMLSYSNPQSYIITELGGDWTGNGQMTPNRWYTMDTFVYSQESSHHLQIILKNNGSFGDFYLDSIQCDTVQPPAIVSPVSVPMTIGDFDVASDTASWAFQSVVDTVNGTGTFSWNSTIGTQNGVMALNFNQVNQGMKITSIPTYGIATNRNALLSFKFRSNLSSPTTLHVLGYLYGERDVATFKVDLARKGVLGNFSGNQWNTVYVPLSSVSGNTSFRLQLVVKNNTQTPESVYLDDVQLCYSTNFVATQQWVELLDELTHLDTRL